MRFLSGAVLFGALFTLLAPAADKPLEEGFVALFNGKDLTGWQGDTKGYQVEEGAIVCRKGGNLLTEKEYENFVLRLDIKIPSGGNNGVGIRAPSTKGDIAYTGFELQVLDDQDPKYKGKIAAWQAHGSIYGVAPAKQGHLKAAGEWNEQEIRVEGNKIKVTLNGTVIVDADLTPFVEGKEKTPSGNKPGGLMRKSGFVGFLGHGDPVSFKNIRIKEIK